MKIFNDTSITVKCMINNKDVFLIEPKNELSVYISDDVASVDFFHLYNCKKNVLFERCNLNQIVLNSKIVLDEITDKASVVITGEIVHFELGYAYDRFFLCANNCRVVHDELSISDMQQLRKCAYKQRKKESHWERIDSFFLSGGFGIASVVFALFKLCFWARDWKFSWWWLPIFWVVGYLFLILGEKIVCEIEFRKQPQLHLINKYSSIEYIKNYYKSSNRSWIADGILKL